mgnify:CR=1 FL=1
MLAADEGYWRLLGYRPLVAGTGQSAVLVPSGYWRALAGAGYWRALACTGYWRVLGWAGVVWGKGGDPGGGGECIETGCERSS